MDILKVLEKCDEKRIDLPRFVIFEPNEVLIIPGEVSSGLKHKVNEICVKLGNFSTTDNATTQMQNVDSPKMSLQSLLTYAVVLQNPPK